MRTTSSREVHRNPWTSVREDDVPLPDGQPGLHGVVAEPDSALVIPREDDALRLVQARASGRMSPVARGLVAGKRITAELVGQGAALAVQRRTERRSA